MKTCRKRVLIGSIKIHNWGEQFNYISCVFIGYKNVFGPIAVLGTNRFRLEQKSYLPLKLQFMSGFGKTIFNGLLGNRPNVFCWASNYLIWSSFWRPSISGTVPCNDLYIDSLSNVTIECGIRMKIYV